MLSASVPELPVPELPVPECIHTDYARGRGLEAVEKHHPSCKGAVQIRNTHDPSSKSKLDPYLEQAEHPRSRVDAQRVCRITTDQNVFEGHLDADREMNWGSIACAARRGYKLGL